MRRRIDAGLNSQNNGQRCNWWLWFWIEKKKIKLKYYHYETDIWQIMLWFICWYKRMGGVGGHFEKVDIMLRNFDEVELWFESDEGNVKPLLSVCCITPHQVLNCAYEIIESVMHNVHCVCAVHIFNSCTLLASTTPNIKSACFECYIKIINTFLKIIVCI